MKAAISDRWNKIQRTPIPLIRVSRQPVHEHEIVGPVVGVAGVLVTRTTGER